jgi:hypothetical protein
VALGYGELEYLRTTTVAAIVIYLELNWKNHASLGQPRRLSLRGIAGLLNLPLFYGHVVVGIGGPNVVGAGADEAVVVELLNDVGCPATDAGDGKNRRKEVNVDS